MSTPKKPTLADIARAAGVSTATVSRVVNGNFGKVSKVTRTRIIDLIEELNYEPMRLGRAPSRTEAGIVALLTPDTRNAFYASIADELEQAISATGKAMVLCHTREDPDIQDRHLRQMQSHGVAGIALLGAVPSPGLARAVESGRPLVFVNRKCPYGAGHAFVGIDNYSAGADVARHFLDCGYDPVGMVHGPLNSSASLDRYEGFRDALEIADRPLADNRVIEGGLSMESGYHATTQLLDRAVRLRAIFCANDAVAYGAYHRCQELGLTSPEDIALFGFDDNPYNAWLAPWLSTIAVPCVGMGQQIAELLASGPAPPRQYLLPYELKLRHSA
ncbi:MAG: LacI family DNA-binding transcriptional regulator [Salinisphaera sp.]|uniref:LacI family DNA-binding transcriptional regulator n=1 Tax=Salinisphaera sp. TaxID=1914330 RepID=UPI003C7E6B99